MDVSDWRLEEHAMLQINLGIVSTQIVFKTMEMNESGKYGMEREKKFSK